MRGFKRNAIFVSLPTVLVLGLALLGCDGGGGGDGTGNAYLSYELMIRNSSNESVINLQKGEVATFVLTVSNDTSEEINITYDSSQWYDFLVLHDTDVVWQWSYGMAFITVIMEESILPNTSISFEEEWNQVDNNGISVDTGSYVLKAIYRGTDPDNWGIFKEISLEFSIEE